MIKNSQKHVIDPCLIGPVQVQINQLAFLVFYNRPVLRKKFKHSKVTNGPGSSRFTLVIVYDSQSMSHRKSKNLLVGDVPTFSHGIPKVSVSSLWA